MSVPGVKVCPQLKPERTRSIKHRLFNYPSVKSHKLLLIINSHTYLWVVMGLLHIRCTALFVSEKGKQNGWTRKIE